MSTEPEALLIAADLEMRPASYTRDMRTARLLREQHAEIERLRADAARWKYLKERVEYYDGFACFPDVWAARPHLDSTPYDMLDAAVDAAMREGER